ncbi:MAG: DsbE family thiol:disulfide interchange protein [Pseudomonadota bacterium]
MARFRPLMIAPPLIFAAFAGLAAIGMMREDPTSLPSTRVGAMAPAVTQAGLEGFAAIVPEDLVRGEVTLVNFWASWCPPCRAEHPRLLQMAEEGIPIIGINFRDQAGPATQYLREDGNPFVGVAFDPEARTAIDWGVTAPPETFILNGEGEVVYRFIGPLIGSDYEQRFLPRLERALLAEESAGS